MPSPITNAWDCRTVATDLWERTWAVTDSRCTISSTTKATLLDQIHTEITYLISTQVNGRWWWSGSGRVGDDNVDRFVLAPLTESILHLSQAQLLTSDIPTWLSAIQPCVVYQRSNYGTLSVNPLFGEYFNMDAAYALVMGCSGILYNNSDYTQSAASVVQSMAGNVLSGGGARYIIGTNPAAVYTLLNINLLSRYWQVTGDTQARDILVAMEPHFPTAWSVPGIPEGTSGPWWKHSVCRIGNPGYFDIIAGLTGDAQNKYFADRLLDLGMTTPEDAVIGANFWRSDITGQAPADKVMFPDGDIGGLRGRFDKFTWVGSLGINQDAFAGAQTTVANLASNSSFEATGTNNLPKSYSCYSASGTAAISTDTTVFRSGGKSVKITCTNSDRGEIYSRFSVTPGHTYKASVWYSSDSNIPNTSILMRFICFSGTTKIPWQLTWNQSITGGTSQLNGENLHVIANQISPNGWTLLSLTFQAPTSATRVTVEDFNWFGAASVWFDDESFEDLNRNGQTVAFDSSLLLVTPEVGLTTLNPENSLISQAAYVSGTSYSKSTLVAATQEFGVLSASYRPRKPTNLPPPENPQTNWQVDQLWLYLPDHVIGRLTMTSLTAHTDPYVRMRIRTEPNGWLTQTSPVDFATGNLRLSLLANNFPSVTYGDAQIQDYTNTFPDADEIFLEESGTTSHSYTSGQKYDVALNTQPSSATDPTGYTPLQSGTLTGFRVTSGLNTYDLWLNPSGTNATLNYTLQTNSLQTISRLYVSSGSCAFVKATSGISAGVVNKTLSAGATACVVTSQNLVLNPGFESLSASNLPDSFSCYAATGSPVIAADASVTRTGYVSLKMTCDSTSRAEALPSRYGNVAGNKYQLTLWYQTNGAIAANAVIVRLMAWKTSGNTESDKIPAQSSWITSISGATAQITGNNLHIIANQTSAGTWTPITVTFQLPSTVANGLSLEYFNWYGNGTVWFDDLSLVQVP